MGIKSVVVLVFIILSFNVLQISHKPPPPSPTPTTTTARLFKWKAGYILWSPDSVEKLMIGINGAFPGPTIRANVGDTIVVELKNDIPTEEVVIHWHGMRQFGTPWADGTAAISQCAIRPGDTFVYNFTVDKAGTYFYHGHYGMQRAAGLYGSLIVDLPKGKMEPFYYDEEFSLLLSDWYHQSVFEQMAYLDAQPIIWIGNPQSLLINGRGQFNCSTKGSRTCSRNTQCSPVVFTVQPNKKYRLRIASVTSIATLNLAIGSHNMTVVEADGNYVEPFIVSDIDIYSGESYSVIITTNANSSSNYWISVGVIVMPASDTPPALAILNYLPNSHSTLPPSPPPIIPEQNDYAHSKNFSNKIFSRKGTLNPPTNSDRLIALLSTQNVVNGYAKWSINNISLVFPTTPYLGGIWYGINGSYNLESPPDNFTTANYVMKPPLVTNSKQGSYVYKLKFNSTVDVILQSAKELLGGTNAIHPWHFHGHDFWVLGYGDGRFNESTDVAKFNLKNPPLRNTVVMFPYGWTAIRFVANNPGVWPLHCHVEPHFYTGMGVVFAEGVDRLTGIPDNAMECGMTREILMKKHLTYG